MEVWNQKSRLLITCTSGIAPYLEAELKSLGFPILQVLPLGVFTEGTLSETIALNLQLRTGLRVLYHLHSFQAENADEVYFQLQSLPWESLFPTDGYVCVTSAVSTPSIQDDRYANVRCKDAIVDRFQHQVGRRPDSGPQRDRSVVFLYWKDNSASIYIDTSGEPLSRRGYRKIPFKAPMQETLAAAVLLAAAWEGECHFVNPMCGSGTLAIEAAMMAIHKAPGLLRHNFGFMHIKGFDSDHYQSWRRQLRESTLKKHPYRIVLGDIDPQAIAAARQNAKTAGVDGFLEFHVGDFRRTPIPAGDGVIMMNPAYGMRLGEEKALQTLYQSIGDFFKQSCSGYRGFIFTGNLSLAKKVGLKSTRRLVFYNGPIESRLLEYDLYAGRRERDKLEQKMSPGASNGEEESGSSA
ncbi:MAG: class I SAM-dependent RNA methyltransferase [Calditrichaeota bacterium]|nr:MAG: class I SAM-dependent RNA methyltransferase [Calditrichota bacterium]